MSNLDYKDQLIEYGINSGIDDMSSEIEKLMKNTELDISKEDKDSLILAVVYAIHKFKEDEVNNQIATETDMLMDQEKDRKAGI